MICPCPEKSFISRGRMLFSNSLSAAVSVSLLLFKFGLDMLCKTTQMYDKPVTRVITKFTNLIGLDFHLPKTSIMKVGIIGSGIVGQTLGAAFLAEGYEVMVGTRNPGKEEVKKWKQA